MRNSENILARTFGCARYMYNWGLRLRTDAFYEHQQRIGYTGTCKLLTALKQEPDKLWLSECSNWHGRTFFKSISGIPAANAAQRVGIFSMR